MNKKNTAILISGLTILFTKLILFIVWNTKTMSPYLTDKWHHMYTGIIFMILARLWKNRLSLAIFSIGLGLFLDEFVHLLHLLHIVDQVDYWSIPSYITTIIIFIVFYFFVDTVKW